MVMTYIGSLKTLVYWPIFRIFGASPWTLRLPVVLLGAITIFVFFHLARASGGARAAAIGAFLLATDPVFLLTNTFDWGPVALEHVFLVTGCWFVYRFGSQIGPNTGPVPESGTLRPDSCAGAWLSGTRRFSSGL